MSFKKCLYRYLLRPSTLQAKFNEAHDVENGFGVLHLLQTLNHGSEVQAAHVPVALIWEFPKIGDPNTVP